MTGEAFLEALGLIIIAAAAMMLVGRQLRIPSIVAYMFAGLLIGPVLGLLPESATQVGESGEPSALATISEIGIVLLLFLVGLEMSLKEIKSVGPVALIGAIGQMLVMGAGVLGIGLALGFNTSEALILAIAFGFSSTVVVVKVLDQRGEIESPYGRIAVGILLVQDIAVIIVLTVLAGLGSSGEEGSMDVASIATGIGRAFLFMTLLMGLTLLAARYILPWLFSIVSKSPRASMIWALAWCFLLVELAHLMGLSVEIGSFLAGVSLGQLPRRNDLRRRVRPLMNFFIAVFFVTLGSEIDPAQVRAQWPAVLILSTLVVLVKPPVFLALIGFSRYTKRTAFDAALCLGQISEFSLILGAAAYSAGLFGDSEEAVSLLSVVGLTTIVASVVLMGIREPLYRRLDATGILDRLASRGDKGNSETHHDHPHDHIVIVGMNSMGRSIAHALAARGERVLAIDTDPHKLAKVSVETRLGDISYDDTLAEANLHGAKLAISALKIDEANRMFAHRCSTLGIPVAIHGFDRSVLDGLERLSPDFVLNSKAAADERLRELMAACGAQL
ncbi:MAG: cation:proton antiporter [Phycisphaerales bacterium JB050]